jgi:hypothetical protein
MVPLAFRSLLLSIVVAGIVSVFIAPIHLLRGEQTLSATLREVSAGVSWTGNAVASSTTFDPATCQNSKTCDVFTLTVDISDTYRQKHPSFGVAVRIGWDDPQTDFDLYVSNGDEMIGASSQGQTDSEQVYLDQPANGVYHVITHTVSAAPATGYVARIRVLPSTPVPLRRTAHYKKDPDGIDGPVLLQFAPEQLPADTAIDENARTSIEIDAFGSIHLGSDAATGDSITDRTGTLLRVFTGASRGEIYLARCESPCTRPVTRRIFSSRNGSALDHPCPVIAADQAGGLHIAFSDGRDVSLISSADHGATWKDPVPVTNPQDPETRTAASPSIFAGDSGRVGLLWVNEAGELYYGLTLDAFAPVPTFEYVRLADEQEHVKLPSGTVDPYGNAAIVYGSSTLLRQSGGDRLFFASLMTVAGTLQTETGVKRVGFTVRQDFGGYLTFDDEGRKLSMKAARFTSSRYVDGKIALSGWGNLQDGTPVTFTILTNVPENDDHDFSISMSNGYFAAGVLQDTPLLAAKMHNESRRTK